jgi:hypothetical protein
MHIHQSQPTGIEIDYGRLTNLSHLDLAGIHSAGHLHISVSARRVKPFLAYEIEKDAYRVDVKSSYPYLAGRAAISLTTISNLVRTCIAPTILQTLLEAEWAEGTSYHLIFDKKLTFSVE